LIFASAPIKSITYDFIIVEKIKNTENIRKTCSVKTPIFTKNYQKISARPQVATKLPPSYLLPPIYAIDGPRRGRRD
jgi:hypothetical protein